MIIIRNPPAIIDGLVVVRTPVTVRICKFCNFRTMNNKDFSALWVNPNTKSLVEAICK